MTHDTKTYIGITYQNGRYKVARDVAGFPVIEPDESGAIMQAKRNVTQPIQFGAEYWAVMIARGCPSDMRAEADRIQAELQNGKGR